MRPGALEERRKEQAIVLDRAAPLVKSGGRIAYVTCSVLEEENGAQVRDFAGRHPEFSIVPPGETCAALGERAFLFRTAARCINCHNGPLFSDGRRYSTFYVPLHLIRKEG